MRNVLVIMVCAVALLIFLWSRNPAPAPHASPSPNVVQKTQPLPVGANPSAALTKSSSSAVSFSNSEVMNALRAAFGPPRNDAALEAASAALLAYINAHPELVGDYVQVLRNEQHEHVLRRFTFALADSEIGLLANDEIVQATIDMAKDRAIEQRQHIMLHLMSRFPEMRTDVYEAVRDLSRTDPNPQVKNSALTVMADWMETHPDKTPSLINDVQKVFETTDDEEVRAYTYQLLGLHTEKLPPELHQALFDRLKTETDSFNGNLLAAALVGASVEIREDALAYVRQNFVTETDMEKRRNLLIQMVCLAGNGALPLLQENSVGDSPLAVDAAAYARLLERGEGVEPAQLFALRAEHDTKELPHEDHDKDAEEKMRDFEAAKAVADKDRAVRTEEKSSQP